MNFEDSKERGASLLEYLFSFAILVVSSVALTHSLSDIIKGEKINKAAKVVFEKDQLVRYEIGKILDRLQKRFTEQTPNRQCLNPYTNFIDVVQTRFALSEGTYFGKLPEIALEPRFPAPVKTRIDQLSSTLKASKKKTASMRNAEAALKRCAENQTIGKTTSSIRDRNSFYFCGYGEEFFVEVKATFWDFNTDSPLTCNTMNEKTGRGIQAVYGVYYFKDIAAASSDQPEYSIRRHLGRLYVAKNVW